MSAGRLTGGASVGEERRYRRQKSVEVLLEHLHWAVLLVIINVLSQTYLRRPARRTSSSARCTAQAGRSIG